MQALQVFYFELKKANIQLKSIQRNLKSCKEDIMFHSNINYQDINKCMRIMMDSITKILKLQFINTYPVEHKEQVVNELQFKQF